MTRLQKAIAAAEKGDENDARSVMALMREWYDRFIVFWAIIRHAHQLGNEGYVTEVLLEAKDAAKRIRSEVSRAEAQIFHATSLARIGRLDEALIYAREIPDHIVGYHAVEALVSIALALRQMDQPYDDVLEEAGKLSQTVTDTALFPEEFAPNWLGLVALRNGLFWWKRQGCLDEIMPFTKKYLTDPEVMNGLLQG